MIFCRENRDAASLTKTPAMIPTRVIEDVPVKGIKSSANPLAETSLFLWNSFLELNGNLHENRQVDVVGSVGEAMLKKFSRFKQISSERVR